VLLLSVDACIPHLNNGGRGRGTGSEQAYMHMW